MKKGEKLSEELKKKLLLSHLGKHLSDEHKKNMSIALKGHRGYMKGKHQSEEAKKKISDWQKGRKKTKEHNRKNSEAQMGEKNHMFGKKLSEEHKKKFSFSGHNHSEESKRKLSEKRKGNKNPMFGKILDKNPAWLGGKSFEPYSLDWTQTLRIAIRERDNYTCQICGKYQSNLDKKVFAVHHIDYDKKNCNPNNLGTLCNYCHLKTNTNRDYWINFFKNEN